MGIWGKVNKLNRFRKALKLYQELLDFVKDKEYFVITTNVDGQFEIAGFDIKIFAVQGDYRFLQCENACHNKFIAKCCRLSGFLYEKSRTNALLFR